MIDHVVGHDDLKLCIKLFKDQVERNMDQLSIEEIHDLYAILQQVGVKFQTEISKRANNKEGNY